MEAREWVDVGIFVLLIVWFILDRCNVYFRGGERDGPYYD